ncbi:hypothetical protein [Ralstonia solanacearum]|uniref:Transmembrane protein n=1 Tax=Ralstonia solanacearum TaxID=305 RepID=A0AAE3T7D4_RALSL|nr:hypothetical protein [Ralstonia solanacearum]MDB0524279.1 hypothetical protein [Ralstonia solanacearum]
MNKLAFDAPSDSMAINVSAGASAASDSRLTLLRVIAVTIALLATVVSFGIAAYSSWLRGGTLVQRTMMVALAGATVLYVHLIPMGWRAFTAPIRVAGGALWCVGIAALMVGQVTFFVEAQRDAGNQRVASVPAAEASHRVGPSRGRSLSEIAGSQVQVVADLARINARHCVGDCPSVAARKAKLSAQLAALDAETAEAKRRDAEEDRLAARAERDEALRESLRADPVASQIALWLGTTAQRLELVQAITFAVVLEGAAIMGWLLVANVWPGSANRVPVVPGPASGITTVVSADSPSPLIEPVVAADLGSASDRTEDDHVLDEIHAEVVAGRLKPTQAAIREFLGRGQATAGRFARLYRARFNNVCA